MGIVLTSAEADQVRGVTTPGHELKPVLLNDGNYALPDRVLTDPAHAEHHAFLSGLPTRTIVYDALVLNGDSQTVGAGASTVLTRWHYLVSTSYQWARPITNYGVGGTSPTQIAAAVAAMSEADKAKTQIIFLGKPASPTTQTYIDAIDAAMAAIPHERVVLFTATNGEYPSEDYPGGTMYQTRLDATAHMVAEYPNNVLDIMQILLDANDGSANDLTDVANEIVPRSLRSDEIHNNDAGHQVVADAVIAFLAEKGW